MFEMGFYLIAVMFSGFTTGSIFVKLMVNARYNYNIKNYLNMVLNILVMPLIPLLFVVMILGVGIGVEMLYIFFIY